MNNLITSDFNGTNVLFQENAFLHATAISTKHGKKAKDYLRNDRTKEYITALLKQLNSKGRKIPFDENQLVIIKKGSPSNGGGTWLHPKLAIDFARWLSAEFAVWCDEKIEKILHNMQSSPQKEDKLSTSDDRVPLRQAVSMLVSKKGLVYSEAYTMVNQRFDNDHLDELTVDEVPQAVKYVHELTMSNLLEGDLMPREVIEKADYINPNKQSRVAGIAMMHKGTLCKAKQSKHYDNAETILKNALAELREAKKHNGSIHEGLSEARLHFKFDSNENREAKALATKNYKQQF